MSGLLLLGAVQAAHAAPRADAAQSVQAAPPCAGTALPWQALGPGLWWLPAQPGDADANNRGRVSNLVLGVEGRRVWLLGSGPSPAFGRALACDIQQRWGREVSDVISPWPHPQLVLGVGGLHARRHWGHTRVAEAMRQRCAGCVQRLRAQLGPAATDLGEGDPVQIPQLLLQSRQGRLGPWRWWLLSRGPGFPVTVWQWGALPLRIAPGLLWTGGAPDGRDADLQVLAQSTRQLSRMPGSLPAQQQWLGEQGPPGGQALAAEHARYWHELLQAVRSAQALGQLETDPPPTVAGWPANDPRHALNWQRAWRQLEAEGFQRSLR